MSASTSDVSLEQQLADALAERDEARDALQAIFNGEVDALVVPGAGGGQLFSRDGAEQPYRVLVEAMSEGAALLVAGNITYCNGRFAHMVGVPLDQIIGASFDRFVQPPFRPALEDLLSAATVGPATAELALIAPGNSIIPAQASANMIDLAGTPAIGVVVSDVSALLRAEEARRVGAYNRSLIEASPDPLFLVGPDGLVRDVNHAAETITGLFRASMVGQPSPIPAGLANGAELEVRHRDGHTTTTLLTVSTHLDEVTGAPGTLIGLRDITERKRADDALRVTQEQLLKASRVAGMAEVATNVLHNVGNALNSVNISSHRIAEAIRRSRPASLSRVSALLAEHADDLSRFLTEDPIGRELPTYLRLLVHQLADPERDLTPEIVSLQKSVEHIREIVRMQQSYARGTEIREAVAIPELVEDAIRISGAELPARGVILHRDFQAVPVFPIEKHRVLEILVNVLENAVQALAGVDDRHITIQVTVPRQDIVSIAIGDTGVGIDAANLGRIFEHGFTTRVGGHGFGLHSGALAARALGGALTVQSDGPGTGAIFTLSLPVAPAGEANHDR